MPIIKSCWSSGAKLGNDEWMFELMYDAHQIIKYQQPRHWQCNFLRFVASAAAEFSATV